MYIYVYVVCMMISPDIYACMIYKIFNLYIYIYILYIYLLCAVYIYIRFIYIYIYIHIIHIIYYILCTFIYMSHGWYACLRVALWMRCPSDGYLCFRKCDIAWRIQRVPPPVCQLQGLLSPPTISFGAKSSYDRFQASASVLLDSWLCPHRTSREPD